MTIINPKSISGITSITLPSGGDNVLTIHTNDGVERFRVDSSGNVKVGSAATISPDGDVFFTGVCTATTLAGAASGLTGALPALDGSALTGVASTENIRTNTNATFLQNINVSGITTVGSAVTISESGIEASGIGITCANINGEQIGGRRNLIINGAMQIAQRATSVSVSDSVRGFQTLDRFEYNTHDTITNVMTMEQSSDSPDGFSNSLKFSTTTADASLTDGQSNYLTTELEGQDLQQLAYGTSSAKSFTLSFYVKGTITGTYVVWFYSSDTGKALTKTYTISSANTWERKTITVAGDTASAIANDNGSGLFTRWILSAGPDYSSGTASTTWSADGLTAANRYVGQTANVAATTSDNWAITGVQLEIGSQATAFEHRSFGEELNLCRRYFQQISPSTSDGVIAISNSITSTVSKFVKYFNPNMRAAPTLNVNGTVKVRNGSGATQAHSGASITLDEATTSVAQCRATNPQGGLSSGGAGQVRIVGGTTNDLQFIAEL